MNVPNRRIGRRRRPPCRPGQAYGTLDGVTDSEHRALRSIRATTREVAARTVTLLAGLAALPGVRIFQGVRPVDKRLPPVPLAISRGRRLILVESVAWPEGCYESGPDGAIRCDGRYIGQSTGALSTTVLQWRGRVPERHRVTAIVVVHPAAGELVELPRQPSRDVSWALAADAPRVLCRAVLRERRELDPGMFHLLEAATS